MRCIIALAGPSKSGKTTLAKKLAVELGVVVASFGDQVRKEAFRKGLSDPSTRELQMVGAELLETDVVGFCQAALKDAGFSPSHGLVVDGIRHVVALSAIKVLVGEQPVKLVYLESSLAKRQKLSLLTAHQLKEIDTHPVENDAEKLRAIADLVLDTTDEIDKCFAILLQWVMGRC